MTWWRSDRTRSIPLLVGCYTAQPDGAGSGRGICGLRVDLDTGVLTEPVLLAETSSPSYLAVDDDLVLCVNEATLHPSGGGVTSFAVSELGLVPRSSIESGDGNPCHLLIDAERRLAVVANYGGSVAVAALGGDGELSLRHTWSAGSASHPHQIVADPSTSDAYLVPDLGLDVVHRLRVADDGRIDLDGVALRLPSGTGPRHLAFDVSGRLHVLGEFASTLVTAAPVRGAYEVETIVSTVPAGFTERNAPAAIRVDRAFGRVMVSNRGHGSVAVFAGQGGSIAPEPSFIDVGGGARDILLLDGEALLVAACPEANAVTVHDVSPGAGFGRVLSHVEVLSPTALCEPPNPEG